MTRQASKAGAKAVAKAGAKKVCDAAPLAPVAVDFSADLGEVPVGTSETPFTAGAIVRWAVKSLYREEALPRGPLLQWLLSMLLGVKLGHKDLRAIIEAEEGLRLEPPNSKKLNFHVALEEEPSDFTGFVTDSEVVDELTEDLWEEAAICLSQGGWPKAEDTAHKYYVVASWLQDVSVKFKKWSFGRVLAVLRFAAQADCLLGHRGGLLVPYEHSEECERRVNAWKGEPTQVQDGESYVMTWPELQDCLHRLLRTLKAEALEVSKLKTLFRTTLSIELSETVFGHQSVTKMLQDERIGEDFELEAVTGQGTRYMLTLRKPTSQSKDSDMVAKAATDATGSVPPPPPGLCLPEGLMHPIAPPPGLGPPDAEHVNPPVLADSAEGEAPTPEPGSSTGAFPAGASPVKTQSKRNRLRNQLGQTPEKTGRKVSSASSTAVANRRGVKYHNI